MKFVEPDEDVPWEVLTAEQQTLAIKYAKDAARSAMEEEYEAMYDPDDDDPQFAARRALIVYRAVLRSYLGDVMA